MTYRNTDTDQNEFSDIESELTELLNVEPPAEMRESTLAAMRTELKPSRKPMMIRFMSVAAAIIVACIVIYQVQKPGLPTTPADPAVDVAEVNQLIENALAPGDPDLPTFGTYRGKTMAELDALLDEHERRLLVKSKDDTLQAPVIRTMTPEESNQPHPKEFNK